MVVVPPEYGRFQDHEIVAHPLPMRVFARTVDKLASSIPQAGALAVMHLHILIETEHLDHVLHLTALLAYHQKGIIDEELDRFLQLLRFVERPHTRSLVSGPGQSSRILVRLLAEETYLPWSLWPVAASMVTVLPKDRISQLY